MFLNAHRGMATIVFWGLGAALVVVLACGSPQRIDLHSDAEPSASSTTVPSRARPASTSSRSAARNAPGPSWAIGRPIQTTASDETVTFVRQLMLAWDCRQCRRRPRWPWPSKKVLHELVVLAQGKLGGLEAGLHHDALSAIGWLSTSAQLAVGPLAKMVRTGGEIHARVMALLALGWIAKRRSHRWETRQAPEPPLALTPRHRRTILATVRFALRHAEPRLRAAGLATLTMVADGPRTQLRRARALLADPSPRVRINALGIAIAERGLFAASVKRIGGLLGYPDAMVRLGALLLLRGLLPHVSGKSKTSASNRWKRIALLVPQVVALTTDRAAGDPLVTPDLMRKHDRRTKHSWQIAETAWYLLRYQLRHVVPTAVAQALITMLGKQHLSASRRSTAIALIGQTGALRRQATTALERALASKSYPVRLEAACVLADIAPRSTAARAFLLRVVRNRSRDTARALTALARLRPVRPYVVELLRVRLKKCQRCPHLLRLAATLGKAGKPLVAVVYEIWTRERAKRYNYSLGLIAQTAYEIDPTHRLVLKMYDDGIGVRGFRIAPLRKALIAAHGATLIPHFAAILQKRDQAHRPHRLEAIEALSEMSAAVAPKARAVLEAHRAWIEAEKQRGTHRIREGHRVRLALLKPAVPWDL